LPQDDSVQHAVAGPTTGVPSPHSPQPGSTAPLLSSKS
jgi:hypothetical protein